MKPIRIALPLAALLALAACQEAPEKKAPAPAKAAEPAPAVEGPLSVYVGKTVFERVDGTSFADDERVLNAVGLAVRNEEPRAWVVRDGTRSSPIVMRDGRLQAHGCDAASCAGRNWTILIDPFGAMAEVCYRAGGRTRWYGAGRTTHERPGDCPGA